jgi:hypothetical protein
MIQQLGDFRPTVDFGTGKGFYYCKIYLSDNTGVGFYSTGSNYLVVMGGEVSDEQPGPVLSDGGTLLGSLIHNPRIASRFVL